MAISIQAKIIGVLFLVVLLASTCQPVRTATQTSVAVTETATPTSTSTPAPSATLTATITLTVKPSPTSTPIEFPEEIYPPALPLQFGAWQATSGCPNYDGLQVADDLPVDVVVQGVSELLFTGNKTREKAASDSALWPLLPFADRAETSGQSSMDESWIDVVRTASESEFAQLLLNQCGEQVAAYTWVAKICPGPCATNASESLKDDLFFVKRNERWLIWALY